MKKFLFKILIFSLPIISLGFEVFLPISTFTFRPDESLLFKHPGIGTPFYPNQRLEMQSVGDLCAYTEYSVNKNLLWLTDEIGYRNDVFIENPDVVIIGDSFVLGSGSTQDSTLANLLNSKFDHKLKFYNLAPASLLELKVLLDNNIIKKPRLVIFELGERIIPQEFDLDAKGKPYKSTRTKIWLNKVTRLYSINFVLSRTFNKRTIGQQSEINKEMFFLMGENQINHLDKVGIIAETIGNYKSYCDSMGICFLFLACPNKESVYWEEVPSSEQPKYLFELEKVLDLLNISNINSLNVFNLYRQENETLIYHLDDTHWNSNGINLIAEEIVKEIITNQHLDIFGMTGLEKY
jgi:hypothetical protein